MDPYTPERAAALKARVDQVTAELDDAKRQLAEIEALVCQCRPEREHGDYTPPADYLHAADCPVIHQPSDALTQNGASA